MRTHGLRVNAAGVTRKRGRSSASWAFSLALSVAMAMVQTGCEQPGARHLVVATSWPVEERLRLQSEFEKWLTSSPVDPGGEPVRLEWLLLEPGDSVEPLARRRSPPDVLLGGCASSYERLSREERLLPVDSLDSARWCVSRLAASRSTGRGDPRTDTRCLAWARSQLEPGGWREGYSRLIDVAGHSPRIGRRAGLSGDTRPNSDLVALPGFPPPEGVGILAGSRESELARKFVRFLLETRQAELGPRSGTPASGFEGDFDSLVADLLGATLVDAHDELWAAWEVFERAGSPESARKWLTEPPPWPPASIEKYLKREGEHAMSLIETLVGELSPRPGVRAWLIRSWLAPPRIVDEVLLNEMIRAADGELVHEPRFRSWLRAEWTASARQRYRRVAKLASMAQAPTVAH